MKRLAVAASMIFASTLLFSQAPADAAPPATAAPTSDATSETRPLTGARNLGLGLDAEHQNILESNLSVSESVSSNARLASSTDSNQWSSVSGVSGTARLSRATGTTSTDFSYIGSAGFYPDNTGYNTHSHEFGIAQTFSARRWTLMLADSFNYEPEGSTGLPIFGPDGADLRDEYLPNGTILTPITTRFSNTSVAELEYGFSRKTAITATGSYTLLKFPDSELLETTQRTFAGGMNHTFGRNTFAVSYRNTMFRYQNLPETMETHSPELSIARRVSRRLSLDIGAGPEVLITTVNNVRLTEVLAAGHVSILRRDGRTMSSLSYSRGVTGGSGVMPGAKTDDVAGQITRAFGRDLSLTATTSYARNSGALVLGTFKTVSAKGGVVRRLGRNASMALVYCYQRQISNGDFDNLQSHGVTFSLTWVFRPVHLK